MEQSILTQIKTLLEVELDEQIFDDQLLLHINSGLSYLMSNKVPVCLIDKDTTKEAFVALGLKERDLHTVLSFLNLYTLQRFDRTLMQENRTTSASWLDSEQKNLVSLLQVIYDNEASI